MMTSLTDSAQLVSLVQAAAVLPFMLLSLWAGAIADSFDRRVVMLRSLSFMLLVSIALAICSWFGLLTPWLLLGFTFLLGCGSALSAPAWVAALADMVPKAALPAAMALANINFNVARSVGPALGGVIVAVAGAAAAFFINALSYIALLIVATRWPSQRPNPMVPRESLSVAMAGGVRYVAMSPNLRAILLRGAVFSIAASAPLALMPLIARDLIGRGAMVYGVLLGSFGVGAVSGALLSARMYRGFSTEFIVRIASLGFAVGIVGASVSRAMLLTGIGLALAGATWVLGLSTLAVAVQMAAPRWMAARGIALFQMAVFGAMTVGSSAFGAIAEHSGVAVALFVAAVAQVAGVLLGLRVLLPQTGSSNLDPFLQSWTEPATALPVAHESGPIVIMIEYQIAQADAAAFLRAMHERRRIRLRDGAHRWSLARNLNDPGLWVERFEAPTWIDYIRISHRHTHADTDNSALIHSLHRSPEPPRVQRMLEQQTINSASTAVRADACR